MPQGRLHAAPHMSLPPAGAQLAVVPTRAPAAGAGCPAAATCAFWELVAASAAGTGMAMTRGRGRGTARGVVEP